MSAATRLQGSGGTGALRVARYFSDLMNRTSGLRMRVAQGSEPSIVFRLLPRGVSYDPEGYELEVAGDGITVSAHDPRGLLYGAVTLWQLCTTDQHRSAIAIPAMKIVDAPRFHWRGLMLDSARHYQSPEFIVQLLDWMALHKLNILHWHLTDDQAWRLEIRKYPRLTDVGAWRVPAGAGPAADIDPAMGRPRLYGGFYSQQTIRRIVTHALERNISIVPEIDIPGHATAAIVAYPRLASVVPAPTVVPSDWGVYSNLYNADESTFTFLEDVLAEVVELFPGKYVHIGGDEAVKDQWKASARVQERMRELGIANETALQGYFVERMGRFLARHGRRAIGWDEVLEGQVAPGTTVMSWRGVKGALAAAAAGHDSVLSPWPDLYFDNRQSAQDTQPGRAHVVSLADVYRFNPLPGALPQEQHHFILGLQANVWTEHVRTQQRVEYMTFPRAAAVAEVGWSAAARISWSSFEARLPAQLRRYKSLGIESAPLAWPPVARAPFSRTSHQLKSCTDKVLLLLEDDAPVAGDRAVFLVDIMNPCWIFEGADLSHTTALQASVGQVPFNFQLGAEVHSIKLSPPQTPYGELEVRLDGCEGERIASISLEPALTNNTVTALPGVPIAHREGTHDLCLRFTQRSLDPLWVIDSIQLVQ